MAISTLNCELSYLPGTVSTTPPTDAPVRIDGFVQDFPGFTATTDSLDVTPISAILRRYIAGIADTGGSVDITMFVGEEENAAYTTMKTAAAGAGRAGYLWLFIKFPTLPSTANTIAFLAELGPVSVPALAAGTEVTRTFSVTPYYLANDGDFMADPET